jgi:hypothetical protein
MPSRRKTSRKTLKKGSRKTVSVKSGKIKFSSRKTSKKRGTAKLVYIGKFRKPSSKKWFKHDIIFNGDNRFNPVSFGKDVIKNDKDENGNYEDPIVYEPILDGDEVVCLGDENSYWCYKLKTIKDWISQNKTTDPMTRKPIDDTTLIALRGNLPQNNQQNLLYPIEQGFWDRYGRYVHLDNNILTFNDSFNQPIEGVTLPYVLEIIFGNSFNQPIDNVRFPGGVRSIQFGHAFNQPISRVRWPNMLTDLYFGNAFNQPISRVRWPPLIQYIEFGNAFNQPIEGVRFPGGVRNIVFGNAFNQPISRMEWPRYLEQITFGENFNQDTSSIPDNVEIETN